MGPAPRQLSTGVMGFTPSGAENVVWRAGAGVFAYAVDNMVILEDLASRKQRYGGRPEDLEATGGSWG